MPKATLDKLWESRKGTEIKIVSLEKSKQVVEGKIGIHLNNTVHISRDGLNPILINYLKEELNFASSEFLIKKKIGKNTWGTERYFKMIEEAENEVILPRGFVGKLLRFCRTNKIECNFFDERIKLNKVTFAFGTILKDSQNKAMDAVTKKDFSIIVAPPGAGKTIICLKIIAEKQQPALIVVHCKHLME